MPSPVQSIVMLTTPLQTGSTVLSGQWDTHTGLRAYSPPPLKRLATDFREICFPEAARNWRRTSNMTSPVPSTTHSSSY
ncbi:hypothetical protein TNCV_3185101 [Trichonephila clavipes]|nr:hypothetical protein TNCV_3185101 [Trichonephila clavipes]